MSVKIQDEHAVAALTAAKTLVELQAPDGRLLGKFVPADPATKVSFPEFGLTDEELELLESAPGQRWYTPEEVMERLRHLTKKA